MKRFVPSMLVAASAAVLVLSGCDRADREQATSQTRDATQAASQKVSDSAITAKVKTALLAEKGVPGTDINVDTSDGRVTLSGKLSDPAQIDKAVQIASTVEGVKGVENKLSTN